MDNSRSAMETALRILGALTRRQMPDPSDVASLRTYANVDGRDLDVVACEVIQRALRHRAALGHGQN